MTMEKQEDPLMGRFPANLGRVSTSPMILNLLNGNYTHIQLVISRQTNETLEEFAFTCGSWESFPKKTL